MRSSPRRHLYLRLGTVGLLLPLQPSCQGEQDGPYAVCTYFMYMLLILSLLELVSSESVRTRGFDKSGYK